MAWAEKGTAPHEARRTQPLLVRVFAVTVLGFRGVDMRVVIVGSGDVGRLLARRLGERQQVLLVDTREECLGTPREPEELGELALTGVTCVHGDGTAKLVLQKLFDPELACALIATTGSDDSNLEAGRMAREVGFEPVIAVQEDSESAEAYREINVTALDRPLLLAEHVERSLKHKGAIVPTGIGLGQGELVEIRLQATSPILGRPLKHLAPHRWRVAAIFRDDGILVPTGETILQEGDRVLLVGDPKILPTVIEYLRLGTPQFPRPYGPNVVTLEFGGPDEPVQAEAERLACGSGAANLVRGLPGAEDNLPNGDDDDPLTAPACKGDVARSTFAVPRLVAADFGERLAQQRPGVVVTRPAPRSVVDRLLGLPGRDAVLCDRVRAPVLFARNKAPYRRILLPVSESEVNIRSAEMAIDISRQLGATLTAMNVDLPQYISGIPDEELHVEVVPIRRLCQLYEVQLDYRHRHGNPVRELAAEAENHDLMVVARRFRRRDTYFDPDVALRLARVAPCSVIVLTIQPEA
jgi:Trk K+ transport system NAD-binding subunit/nucleotide-binding universal stress UspA family protein